MHAMKIKSLTLAVVAGLALAISAQAQQITGDTYLDNFTVGALYGAWSSATLNQTPTGLEVQSLVANGYGSGYFIINGPAVQVMNANDNALQLQLTINGDATPYVWFGPSPVILNDDLPPPTSYTYNMPYNGYLNGGNPPNAVYNGNTVTITVPLAAGQITKIQGGSDHIYAFNLGLDPAVINTPTYDVTFNSVTLIPEPTTVSLVGIGAVLLGWVSLRRRHTS